MNRHVYEYILKTLACSAVANNSAYIGLSNWLLLASAMCSASLRYRCVNSVQLKIAIADTCMLYR